VELIILRSFGGGRCQSGKYSSGGEETQLGLENVEKWKTLM
jgi:hypothetical protein